MRARIDQSEIAKAYLEAMPNVSIYGGQSQEIKSLEEENEELKRRMLQIEAKLSQMERLLVGFANGKS